MFDAAVTIAIFSASAAALGFLISRELQRSDSFGARSGRQGETLASVSQSVAGLREDIVRLGAADEALTVRLEANRATLAALNDTFLGQLASVSSAIAKLDATMSALKEAVDRLTAAEDARKAAQPAPPPSQIDQLRQFVELLALMKKQA